jgi:tetratricopeptide (TPR) repeat protein
VSRDPTANEAYVALRNALLAMQDDASALLSVLSSVSDGGESFVATAYYELRRALVQGRLQEAETVGKLIGSVLDAKHETAGGAEDEFATNRLHHDAMRWLVDGIGAVLSQDAQAGIRHLERLTEAVYCDDSLQWVAWHWMSRAAIDTGDLALAKSAAESALGLAQGIDGLARGTALCTIAEAELLRDETDAARAHLTEATAVFDATGDRRGTAMAGLTLARVLHRIGREEEAVVAAREAQASDPDWEEPVVFLVERALMRGELAAAEQALAGFGDLDGAPPELARQQRLVEGVRDGVAPLPTVSAYLRLREQPPREADLPALETLWHECPVFFPLRELLAWNLLKLGKDGAAAEHFEALAGQDLDPEVRASVLLGLGCVASHKAGHRQSAARLHAATAASASMPARAAAPAPPAGPTRPATSPGGNVRQSHNKDTGSHPVVTTPSGGPKAVFTGDLQLLAVPDLLEFLKSSRRTGTLVITSERGIGAVHMRDGRITGAASPGSRNMGDLLIEMGRVNEEQLREAAAYQRAEGKEKLLGTILVERGLVDTAALEGALVRQIKGAITELVEWTAGRFAFEPDKQRQRESDDVSVELDTEGVLLDVLRELDERNRDAAEA